MGWGWGGDPESWAWAWWCMWCDIADAIEKEYGDKK